jgi:hypothetical protein
LHLTIELAVRSEVTRQQDMHQMEAILVDKSAFSERRSGLS